MNRFRLHHFGLAAAHPDRAVRALQGLGYVERRAVWDPLQRVHLRWCEREGDVAVEVVTPGGEGGPLDRILAEQASSFYHLCYEISNGLEDALAGLQATGSRAVTVVPPTSAVLFGGRKVSFHMVQGLGLIELLHPPSES